MLGNNSRCSINNEDVSKRGRKEEDAGGKATGEPSKSPPHQLVKQEIN